MKAKTILITGANRGLGSALASIFANQGYRLILHCRHGAQELRKKFNLEAVVQGDLRSPDTIRQIIEVVSVGGRGLDVLINNAGVYLGKSFSEMTNDEIREVIEVNLVAPILLIKAVWSVFLRQNFGLVININSLAGRSGGPGESVYSASKAGLAGFSETVQFDSVKAGIQVVNLNIGAMMTDMSYGRKDRDKFIDSADVAKVIAGLCCTLPSLRISSMDLKRTKH